MKTTDIQAIHLWRRLVNYVLFFVATWLSFNAVVAHALWRFDWTGRT
jgi:hypothetical protein